MFFINAYSSDLLDELRPFEVNWSEELPVDSKKLLLSERSMSLGKDSTYIVGHNAILHLHRLEEL
jgi:hypothetical protein